MTSKAEQPPVPINTSSIGLGPGERPSGPHAVPSTTLCPLPDSPTKVLSSTHLMRAFMRFRPVASHWRFRFFRRERRRHFCYSLPVIDVLPALANFLATF